MVAPLDYFITSKLVFCTKLLHIYMGRMALLRFSCLISLKIQLPGGNGIETEEEIRHV